MRIHRQYALQMPTQMVSQTGGLTLLRLKRVCIHEAFQMDASWDPSSAARAPHRPTVQVHDHQVTS